MTPVHYRGGAEPITSIIAGHVTAGFLNLSDVVPHAGAAPSGRLRSRAKKRVPQLPDVPTVIESGVPGFKRSRGTD